MAPPENDFLCRDCNAGTFLREYYMLNAELWKVAIAVTPSIPSESMLCIGCLESRLGRTLNQSDFSDCALNDLNFDTPRSDRLIDRLRRRT